MSPSASALCPPSLITKFLIWGLKLGWGGFWIRDAISRKRCKIKLRWQLITNRKSVWAFDFNKSRWPWITLNVNLMLCRPWYAYIDQTTDAMIMQFSLQCIAQCLISLRAKVITKFEGVPLVGGLKLGWGSFWLRDAISWKRCEIKLRWQLITNRKSYMGFRL